YKSSIKYEDSKFFSIIINTGLIDTKKYKSEIINYYMSHRDEVETNGIIQTILDEDVKARESKKRFIYLGLTKAKLQQAKIKRLREQDKLKQVAIQKSLEKELADKKRKIREEQVKQLSK
ncbi:MAG: hypothetical protein J7L21_02275, partial [Sulfurimonas sp.]|nr:hypothetical protein [Sulfurimonas sp.]